MAGRARARHELIELHLTLFGVIAGLDAPQELRNAARGIEKRSGVTERSSLFCHRKSPSNMHRREVSAPSVSDIRNLHRPDAGNGPMSLRWAFEWAPSVALFGSAGGGCGPCNTAPADCKCGVGRERSGALLRKSWSAPAPLIPGHVLRRLSRPLSGWVYPPGTRRPVKAGRRPPRGGALTGRSLTEENWMQSRLAGSWVPHSPARYRGVICAPEHGPP